MQIERKGNFIVDFVGRLAKDELKYKANDFVIKLITIPDGKAKKMASKADTKEVKAKKPKKEKKPRSKKPTE